MKKDKIKTLLFFAYIVAILLFGVLLYPFFASLTSETGILSLEQRVQSMGIFGVLLLLAIQVVQIVVALIPGEVVEFVSGAMYGTFFGLLIDLAGIAIGQTVIYFTIRNLGTGIAEKIAGSKKIQKLRFLENEKKLSTLLFILYFIPGTPKDAICYVVPFLKIKFKTFLLLSLFARIPSVVSSTYAGATFSSGNTQKTVIIYVIVGILSVIGLLINNSIHKRREKNGRND